MYRKIRKMRNAKGLLPSHLLGNFSGAPKEESKKKAEAEIGERKEAFKHSCTYLAAALLRLCTRTLADVLAAGLAPATCTHVRACVCADVSVCVRLCAAAYWLRSCEYERADARVYVYVCFMHSRLCLL